MNFNNSDEAVKYIFSDEKPTGKYKKVAGRTYRRIKRNKKSRK